MIKRYLILSLLLTISSLGFTQSNAPFIAHEWGTFTTLQNSNGKRLSGLHVDEEKLPGFTFDFSKTPGNEKGFPIGIKLTNVKVKMETPVIYFYSDVEQQVTVDVKFKNGSISQWYPYRVDGEKLDLNTTEKIDFNIPRTGWIKWNATVLAPTDNSKITTVSSSETEQWKRPRATASNLVKVELPKNITPNTGTAVEKFLFYRGIANFDIPVKVEFNTAGNLIITNNLSEKLNYVMVYEKKAGQCASVWWAGAVNQNRIKVVNKPVNSTNEADLQLQMNNFETNLVNAGLYGDEAKAMLNTWKESYFEHEGIKVFWIAPRSFTEEILPINIAPQPARLERVIVGRSEVLSPEFENHLQNLSAEDFNKLAQDRFYLAYTQLRNEGFPAQWTNINTDATAGINDNITADIGVVTVYPNPTKSQVRISTYFKQASTNIKIQLFNITGTEIYSTIAKAAKGDYNKLIDISEFSPGLYFLKLQFGDHVQTQKLIKEL